MMLHPVYQFAKSFFIQKGYREGERGFIMALYTAASVVNWYIMAWEKKNQASRTKIEEEIKSMWDKRQSGKDPIAGR